MQNISLDIKQIIDSSVYKSFQQFRILETQKLNSNRPKIFLNSFTLLFHNKLIEHIYEEEILNRGGCDCICEYDCRFTSRNYGRARRIL